MMSALNMNLDETVLKHYGGIERNSLQSTLNLNEDENNNVHVIRHSAYYDHERLLEELSSKPNDFTIFSSNIESIYAKFTEIETFIELLRKDGIEFSALCFQECWISNNDDASHIQLDGYELIKQCRGCSKKGGLLIYLHEKFTHSIRLSYNASDIWEGLFIDISDGGLSKPLTIGNIYRPPRDHIANYTKFLEEITPILTLLETLPNEIVLTGDFNINLLKINTREIFSEIFDTFTSNSFFPTITLPTRFSNRNGTLIDNFFCKLTEASLSSLSGICINQFSDHHPYFISLKIIKPKHQLPKYIKVRKYSPNALNNFHNEILSTNILDQLEMNPLANPNDNYEKIEKIITNAHNKCIPSKVTKFNKYKHSRSSWITQGILKSIHYRDKLYKKLKKEPPNTPLFAQNKVNLSTYNKILRQSIRLAKKTYYDKSFTKYKHDIKNTWATINTILQKTKNKRTFPSYFKDDNDTITDKLDIANRFNLFFTNIGKNLADTLNSPNSKNHKNYLGTSTQSRFTFRHIDQKEIENIIKDFTPKTSTGHDNLSINLIKLVNKEIALPLKIIINQMFSTGIFPNKLKIAKIIPIFKKDDDKVFNNYRPISLLPVISKIFEKAMFIQVYDYFQDEKLFYASQYGFRKGHSTEYAALEIVDRIMNDMDKGLVPINIYLDLSKAFDTIDHNILLDKLYHYGIQGTTLNLFKSYLSSRQQYVEYDGVSSDLLKIETGVPQGSVLGPLLFIIYMNDLAKCSTFFDFIIYADDTTLSGLINLQQQESNVDEIHSELDNVSDWLKVNKLSLNKTKTKMMVFHKPQRKIIIPEIKIDGTIINCVDDFNLLGVTLDKHLTWKSHINKVSNKIARTIGILNRLKLFLPQSAKCMIYNSLILSHINYGILLWGYQCDRITKLQKKAVRKVTNSKYNAHTDPLFKSLNLLKVTDIAVLYQLKFYHKYINNELPEYFQKINYFINRNVHGYGTRQNKPIYICIAKHEFSKKCIRHNLPKIINDIPEEIKGKVYTHSLQGFSQYIKRYFLHTYKDSCQEPQCYVCNS